MNDDLKHRLRRAADDSRRPVSTDLTALLDRARFSRRRHRLRVGAAAVLVTGAVVAVSTVGVHALAGGEGGAPERPSAHDPDPAQQPAAVGSREIIDRCQPQLEKYVSNRMFSNPATVDWMVGNKRDYRPGEIVPLVDKDGASNPVLCRLPEEGHAGDAVPWSSLAPDAADPERLAALCDAAQIPEGSFDIETGHSSPGTRTARDLRDAEVVLARQQGEAVTALLDDGGKLFSCSLAPITWDNDFTLVEEVHPGLDVTVAMTTAGSPHKSAYSSGEPRAIYYTAGTMPTSAATIEIRVEGGTPKRYPVTHGAYAFIHEETTKGGLKPYSYVVRDAEGNVLHSASDQF